MKENIILFLGLGGFGFMTIGEQIISYLYKIVAALTSKSLIFAYYSIFNSKMVFKYFLSISFTYVHFY